MLTFVPYNFRCNFPINMLGRVRCYVVLLLLYMNLSLYGDWVGLEARARLLVQDAGNKEATQSFF